MENRELTFLNKKILDKKPTLFYDVITHHKGGILMVKAKEQYTVQLDPEFVQKLDKMAAKIGISRSNLMRNLLENGYEDAVMLDRIGLVAAFKFGLKLIRKIKEGIATGRITFNEDGELKIKDE